LEEGSHYRTIKPKFASAKGSQQEEFLQRNPKRNRPVDGVSSKFLFGDLAQTEDPEEEEKPWREKPIPWRRRGLGDRH
jgi:hypothetical protein